MMTPRQIIKSIIAVTLPPSCHSCGRPLEDDASALALCPPCQDALARLASQPTCGRCGRALGLYSSCPRCLDNPPPFQSTFRIGQYAGPLAELIRVIKYREGRFAVPLLADLLLARLQQARTAEQIDVVTTVPLHWYRHFRRGYNQAWLLGLELGRRGLAAPLRRALVRTRNTPPQVGMSQAARRENVRGAFRVRRPEWIRGRHVLLLDDVMTTGATMEACARVLHQAGARHITVAVAAVAENHPPTECGPPPPNAI